MEETEKFTYVPPTIDVSPVELDANIALQSPIRNIEVEEWQNGGDVAPDTGDIFLAI